MINMLKKGDRKWSEKKEWNNTNDLLKMKKRDKRKTWDKGNWTDGKKEKVHKYFTTNKILEEI
jgi:hypothetical protein